MDEAAPFWQRPVPAAGRGAAGNPPNRFEKLWQRSDPEWTHDDPAPTTEFLVDDSRTIIARNDSPDVGFAASINPYRGCEHGCAYCYARPTHEYLAMSAGLDFESRILVKRHAPELLRAELLSPRWTPQVVAASGVTDCYQPVERVLKLTRRCLEVLAEFRNPVSVITKNRLVARDIDVFARLAAHGACCVTLSITTLKQDLAQAMEPRASVPAARLAAIRELAAAGIPVGVNVAPIVPGLTDSEIPAIVAAAAEAGAKWAGYTMLRLPHAVAPLYEQWLARHAPLAKDKVLARLRELRNGMLYDSGFGTRMRGEGVWAEQIADLFALARRRAGLADEWPGLSTAAFQRPGPRQMDLFADL